jgi:hypothetical protein
MAARRIAKREDLRDTIARNMRILRALAKSAGKPAPELQRSLVMKAKRTMAPRVDDGTYEATIQRDIIAFLRKNPKVAIVERHNSGTAMEINSAGEKRFIAYNTVFKVHGVRMRKSDIDCQLSNGKRLCIEVKRTGWTHPRNQREVEQENYINHVLASTGYAMFATSVAEVEAYLTGIKV